MSLLPLIKKRKSYPGVNGYTFKLGCTAGFMCNHLGMRRRLHIMGYDHYEQEAERELRLLL